MQELLALEEHIGSVSTGLADEKISSCVMEVTCCSSARAQDGIGKENARCVICLVRSYPCRIAGFTQDLQIAVFNNFGDP